MSASMASVAGLSLLALLASFDDPPPIECGQTRQAGVVPAGTYETLGPNPFAAIDAMFALLGIENPDCPGCEAPLVGCDAFTVFQPSTRYEVKYNFTLMAWEVEWEIVENTRWDEGCTSCEDPE